MIPLIASLLLAGSSAYAQDLKRPDLEAKVTPFDLRTQGMTFPSGLQVILQRDEGASVVHVAGVHTGGFVYDTEGKHGTSHLATHLVFWADLEGGTVRDQLYAHGVDYDGLNGADWMVYRASGPASALPTMLKAEGLRITNPFDGVTDEDLAREKQIFALEPYFMGANTLFPAFNAITQYSQGGDHPFGNIGTEKEATEMVGVTMDDIRAYASTSFIPSETTIVVSGAIDFDDTIEILFKSLPPKAIHPDATDENIKQFFKPDVVNPDPENPDHVTVWLEDPDTNELVDLTWAPPNRVTWTDIEPPPVHPDYPKGDVLHISGLVDAPMAVVAWSAPGSWIGEDANRLIGANALTSAGWQSGWGALYDIKRNTQGPLVGCSPLDSGAGAWIVCNAMGRDTKTNADELTDRLKAASAFFADPQRTALHTQVVDGARRAALGNLLHNLENHGAITEGLATRTALNAHFIGDPGYNTKRMQELMKLDALNVRPWVMKWLPEARSVSIVVDPIPRDKWLQITTTATHHASVLGHEIPKVETAPTNEEVAAAFPNLPEEDIVEKTLDNGLRVVVVPFGKVPIVTAALAIRGGSAYDKGMDAYVDATMRRLWDEINEDTTGRKQSLQPERIAAQPVFLNLPEMSFEGFAAPTANLDGALYLLRRNDMARKVNLGGRANWWRGTKQALPESWDQTSIWSLQHRTKQVLPDHEFSWFLDQDAATANRDRSASDLVAYQQRKYRPDNAVLVIIGPVAPDEALKLADEYWGNWKAPATEPLAMPSTPKPAQQSSVSLYNKPAADSTTLMAMCRLPEPDAALLAGQETLASLSAEAFTDELGKGNVGALASSVVSKSGLGVSWLEFAAVVPHKNTAAGIEALKRTITRADDGTHDPTRVQQHKLRLAGSRAMHFSSTRVLLDHLSRDYVIPNRGVGFTRAFGEALVEIDAEALKAAAAGCADSLTVTVETPEAHFGPLQSAYDAQVIDWLSLADAEWEKWDKGAYKRRLKNRAKGK